MPTPRLIDIYQPLASLLDEVRPSRHVLIAVRKGHDLKELHALLNELAIINREVNGMLYLDGTVTAGAEDLAEPAPVAQVIEPGDEVVAGPSPEETTILPKVEVSSEPTPKKTSDNKASQKNDSTDSKDKK